MAALEATVVATAMPTVIAELGGMALYGWVTAGYLLASTVSVPVYGKLADLFGRKPWMLVGIALFLVGSMASGLSRSIAALVLFRVVQGLGAGAMGRWRSRWRAISIRSANEGPLAVTSLLIAVQTSVTWERRGVATASSLFFRTMGGAIWVGALGSVLAAHLSRSFSPDVVGRLLRPTSGERASDLTDATLRAALASGIHVLFTIMACAAIASIAVSYLFPRIDASSLPGAGAPPGGGQGSASRV
jgi:MFS family permease